MIGYRSLCAFFAFLFLAAAGPAWAQFSAPASSTAAGNSCTGAPANGSTTFFLWPDANGHILQCNGTTWGTASSSTAAGSTGQVQFNNGSGALAADSNFYWDNTNKRLGIGTASPLINVDIAPAAVANVGGVLFIRDSAGVAGTIKIVNFNGANYIESGLSTTGSSAAPLYFTNMGANSTWMTISSTGNVGIGTTAPPDIFDVYSNSAVPAPNIIGDGQGVSLSVSRYTTNGSSPFFNFQKARGSMASPSAVSSGDILGTLTFVGYDGSSFGTSAAKILSSAEDNFSTSDHGAYLAFYTTADATTTLAEKMRITGAGNVGIGTTTPYYTLQADGVVAVSTTDYNNTSTGTAFFINPGPTGNNTTKISSWTNGGTVPGNLVINPSGGNVGIGTTIPAANGLTINSVSPTLTFQLSGTSEETLNDDGSFFYVISTSGANGVKLQHGSTLWTSSSDRRIKKDIEALPESYGLSAVERLKPVTFHWREPKSPQQLQIGLIAQDVQQVIPELVTRSGPNRYAPDGELGIEYSGLVIPLIKAVQELKADNEELHREVSELKKKSAAQ
jgi:hypothetical protein